jgi:hypothetical protein
MVDLGKTDLDERLEYEKKKETRQTQPWWFTCIIPATWEGEVGRSQSEANPDITLRPYLQSTLELRPWSK